MRKFARITQDRVLNPVLGNADKQFKKYFVVIRYLLNLGLNKMQIIELILKNSK